MSPQDIRVGRPSVSWSRSMDGPIVTLWYRATWDSSDLVDTAEEDEEVEDEED